MLKGVVLLLVLAKVKGENELPEVQTELGKIRGHYDISVKGRQYYAFEGIPYAKPPIGKYRFKEARPVEPWSGVWTANTLHKCLQYNHYTEPGQDYVIGEEDCLYLNVYTPILNSNFSLDVIVFIHGGGFMFNHGGSYGPKIIMDRDVVFATMNYRLGSLGFLSTEDHVVPGNNGLKDQLLALKWIKKHIGAFGGNPGSITLTGMSAGGASAQIHYLSPLSEGLFHRGFSQSGTALNPWALVENSREKAKRLADKLGCPSENSKEMVDCLRHRPARQIAYATKHFQPWLYIPCVPFGVVIDKWAKDPILPKHPLQLLKSGKHKNVPWIFSNVESEGLYPAADFVADEKYLREINDRWDDLIPFILDFNHTVLPQNMKSVSQKIRDFYFKDKTVSRETFPILVKMINDRFFLSDIERAARLHAVTSESPVYYYYFSYRGAHSKSELRSHTNENFGSAHGDDTVFVLSSNVDTQSTENDRKMSQLLQDMWVSYAHLGYPQIANVTWVPISRVRSDPLQYLHIESPDKINMKTAKELVNRSFWDSLPIKENFNLIFDKDEL